MQRNTPRRDDRSSKLTMADLCKAIEKRRVAYRRDGDAYVVRKEDVIRLRTQSNSQPHIPRSHLTLEVGRSA